MPLTRSAWRSLPAMTRSAVSLSGHRNAISDEHVALRTQVDHSWTCRSTLAGTPLLAWRSSRATISVGFRPFLTALTTDSRVIFKTIAPWPPPRVVRSQNGASSAAWAGFGPITTTLKSG